MIAVTAYISTDVAAAPLLWVLPLALYLLTFVAVFRDRPWFSHDAGHQDRAVPGGAARDLAARRRPRVLARHAWRSTCWRCSRSRSPATARSIARRPAPALLTEFYLWTSFGGVIGGIFAGLLAPHLFNQHLRVSDPDRRRAAGAARRVQRDASASFLWRISPALAVAALAILLPSSSTFASAEQAAIPFQVALVVLVGLMLLRRRDTARFAALAVVAFIVTGVWQPGLQRRSRRRAASSACIAWSRPRRGTHRLLHHGTTIHGAERVREADGTPVTGRPEPLTYYYFGGPISEGVARRARRAGRAARTSRWSGSGPGASPATGTRARAGPSSRSIRKSCGSRAIRPCSASCRVRAAAHDRARRRAADAGRFGAAVRPDRARCVFLRRDPGASAHARGAARLSGAACRRTA